MRRVLDAVLAFISHLAFYLLGSCMTNATKRYMLLASLQVHLVREGILHEETMSKLNRLLDLVKYEDALELPVFLHQRIWGGVDVNQILQNSDVVDLINHCPSYGELRAISGAIAKQTPPWLRYGQDSEYMLQDIMRLLSCQPELHGASLQG